MADLPIVIGPQGLQPLPPIFLRNTLQNQVAATNPGYTGDLPGSLIEDILSTDIGALVSCDNALVDLVNSLTPFGANEFLLNQLGQIYGVTPGLPTNTSAFVVFNGPSGFVIVKGFTVSDGTYQYVVQDGGIIPLDGITPPFFVLATVPGTWTVPAGSINQIVTSLPAGITITVSNPTQGTPGNATGETVESYRARVLQAGRASATGMASFLKTLVTQVQGVDPRLVSVVQSPLASALTTGGGWEVIVGGSGDPLEIAYAIYTALFDISLLVGSTTQITFITSSNPAQISTNINHGFVNGNTAFFAGITASGFTVLNGTGHVVTVVDEKNFTIAVDSSLFAAFTGTGFVTPNNRNQTVSILDYPDTYEVIFVVPPAQTTLISLLWNTDSPDFVSGPSVNALGTPAIATYVNSVPVGAPINIFDMQDAFTAAVASVLPSEFLSRMVWVVTINGIATPPNTGTGLVYGDPESYFLTDVTKVSVSQG